MGSDVRVINEKVLLEELNGLACLCPTPQAENELFRKAVEELKNDSSGEEEASEKGKNFGMIYTDKKAFLVDYKHSLGAACFGPQFIQLVRRITRSSLYTPVAVIVGFAGCVSSLLCLFENLESLSFVAFASLPFYLVVTFHLQVELLKELLTSFDHFFLFGNIIAFSIGLAILLDWELLQSSVALAFMPLGCFPAVFSDALPSSIRANSRNNFRMACTNFAIMAVGLQCLWFDGMLEDVYIFPSSLRISVRQRCISFAINASIFYLKYAAERANRKNIFVTFRAQLLCRRLNSFSGWENARSLPGQLVVPHKSKTTEFLRLVDQVASRASDKQLAFGKTHLIRWIVLGTETPWVQSGSESQGKVVPAEKISKTVQKNKHSTVSLISPACTPFVVDHTDTLGKQFFGDCFANKLACVCDSNLYAAFFVLGIILSFSCFFPGCGNYALYTTVIVPISAVSICVFQKNLLWDLSLRFDLLFVLLNIIAWGLCTSVLFRSHWTRALVGGLVIPFACIPALYFDALPAGKTTISLSIYGTICVTFLLVSAGLQLDWFDLAPDEDVIVFPGVVNLSLKQRCSSFAMNVSIFFFKYFFRKYRNPQVLVILRSRVEHEKVSLS